MSLEVLLSVAVAVMVIAVVVLAVTVARTRRPDETPQFDQTIVIDEVKRAMAHRDGGLDAQVAEMNKKLADLQTSVTGREAALDKQVQGLDTQMRSLAGIFSNDRARGGWGEISLLRIFESAGLTEGRDYTAQFNADGRVPDAVVHLPGGRNIVIDSKFPVARYNEAMETSDQARRQGLLAAQGKELEVIGKDLVTKGYAGLASGGYVVMYIPSQPVYETAAEAHAEVIERLMGMRVVLAGPTTVFALIMHAGALLTEHRSIQQSDQVLTAVRELHKRMSAFIGHLRSLQAALTKTVVSFNAIVGSWTGRVSPQLVKVGELSGHVPEDGPDPIDEAVREIPRDRAVVSAILN